MDACEATKITDESIKRVVQATLEILETQWTARVAVVQFTQGTRRSWARDENGRYKLNFGLPMLRSCMVHGTQYDKVTGWASVVTVAVHEYAHAIQYDMGLIDRDDPDDIVHDDIFFSIFKRAYAQVTPKLTQKGLVL